MRGRYLKAGTIFLRCGLFILLGLWMILWPNQIVIVAHTGTLITLTLLSMVELVEWIAYSPKRSREGFFKLGAGLIYIALLVFVWSMPYVYLSFFSLAFGLWMLLNAVTKTISFILYQIDKVRGRLIMLLLAVLSYGFGLWMLFRPRENIKTVVYIVGFYLLAYGVTHLGDLFRALGITHESGTRRGFRLSLPVAIASLIPFEMIRRVNDLIDEETVEQKRSRRRSIAVPFDEKKEDMPPDLEVFVHVAPKGFRRFGHLDISFEGTVLSYGNYDDKSKHLSETVGDGVLIVADQKEKYLSFCCYENKKTIYGFGLRLAEAQKENVKKKIESIRLLLEPLYPDSQLALMGKLPVQAYKDYASRLYRVTGARFFKFTGGKFKSYFTLGTNCVLLADTLIGATGSDIINLTGVITPGTYYEYLNRQFLIKNSNVISRKVYTEHTQQAIIESFLDRLK